MAGYNWAEGKSNNAVDAEERGLATATATAKACRAAGHKGATSAFIKECALADEWHHTSKMFNKTNYYDVAAVIEWLGTEAGADALTRFKAEASTEGRTTTGTVTWKDYPAVRTWSGEVILKGKSIYFDGQRKLLTGNNIEFIEDAEKKSAHFAQEDAREAENLTDWDTVTGTLIDGDDRTTGEFEIAEVPSGSRFLSAYLVRAEGRLTRVGYDSNRADGVYKRFHRHALDEADWTTKTGTVFYEVVTGYRRRTHSFTGQVRFSGDLLRYDGREDVDGNGTSRFFEHPLDGWEEKSGSVVGFGGFGGRLCREKFVGTFEVIDAVNPEDRADWSPSYHLVRYDGKMRFYDDGNGLSVIEHPLTGWRTTTGSLSYDGPYNDPDELGVFYDGKVEVIETATATVVKFVNPWAAGRDVVEINADKSTITFTETQEDKAA